MEISLLSLLRCCYFASFFPLALVLDLHFLSSGNCVAASGPPADHTNRAANPFPLLLPIFPTGAAVPGHTWRFKSNQEPLCLQALHLYFPDWKRPCKRPIPKQMEEESWWAFFWAFSPTSLPVYLEKRCLQGLVIHRVQTWDDDLNPNSPRPSGFFPL